MQERLEQLHPWHQLLRSSPLILLNPSNPLIQSNPWRQWHRPGLARLPLQAPQLPQAGRRR